MAFRVTDLQNFRGQLARIRAVGLIFRLIDIWNTHRDAETTEEDKAWEHTVSSLIRVCLLSVCVRESVCERERARARESEMKTREKIP